MNIFINRLNIQKLIIIIVSSYYMTCVGKKLAFTEKLNIVVSLVSFIIETFNSTNKHK